MRTRNLALIVLLAVFGWRGVANAQQYAPVPPPDQGYEQPYDQPYDAQGNEAPYYDDQGQGQQPYGTYPDDPNAYTTDNPNQPDVSVFYSGLHNYGRWISRGSYGWVWEPTHVPVGWRPYLAGRWVDTDYGWTWVSFEPWGWATYHYGRWMLDPEYGWLWVPGTEWGPAWVSFQEGDGYIGWAPLPPSVGFRVGFGIQIGGLSLSASIRPDSYCFVPERSFLDERVDAVVLPRGRNVTLFRNTRNFTAIRVVNNRVVNEGIPVQRVEQVTGRRVQRFQVAESRNPAQAPVTRVQGNQVSIFRPATTLARVRPEVTPQAVIQKRVQRVPTQPGQAPRQVQTRPVPVQPGQSPREVQVQPRYVRPMPAPADLERKHQAEQQQLQARQADERNRLQQLHANEQKDQANQARAQQLAAQHQAEMKAQQDQQKRDQQLLQARQQREKQVSRPANQPPPKKQQQDRQKPPPDQQDRRKPKPEPPPPPPGR